MKGEKNNVAVVKVKAGMGQPIPRLEAGPFVLYKRMRSSLVLSLLQGTWEEKRRRRMGGRRGEGRRGGEKKEILSAEAIARRADAIKTRQFSYQLASP